MTVAQPALVIIILHYGSITDTRDCLAALTPGLPADWRVLVIDNGTGTGAADTLGREFPSIDTVTLPANQGWAGGNNVGIAWARSRGARAVCLLNNDTLAAVGAFAPLLGALDQVGDCLLHPAIDYGDPGDGIQLDPAQNPSSAALQGQPHLYPLDFAYGACLMIPCSVFDRVGMFDGKHPVKAAGLLFYWLLGWRGCGGWFCLIILKAGRGRSRLPHLCLDEPLHG
ncbi:glycosyltransferase [Acidiphilium multivorum]|uniref:glycosyltransferase n=1 Tax=Acidiphilium multivorum TaxID=62140 RepID=UPI0039C8E87D